MNLVKGEGLRVKGGTPGAIHTLPPFPLYATGGRK
mgnify:CR=1 FL=1|jgi:hypothetical protein